MFNLKIIKTILLLNITVALYGMDPEKAAKIREENQIYFLKQATKSLKDLEKSANKLNEKLFEERQKREQEKIGLHKKFLDESQKNFAKL